MTAQPEAFVEITGLVTKTREFGSIRFLEVRDVTGNIQAVADKSRFHDEDWRVLSAVRVGDRISLRGQVGRTHRGQLSVFLSEAPSRADTSLSQPISGSESEYANVGAQILLARLRNRAEDFFRDHGYVQIEPKLISGDWKSLGLEPLRVNYPGFGVAAYLVPTPSTQLLDAILATGATAVFASSRCFSTTYRDEKSSVESLIVSAKAVDLGRTEHRQLIQDAVAYVFGGLETFPEAGLHPREEWRSSEVSQPLETYTGGPVKSPTLEIYGTPRVRRDPDRGIHVTEVSRLVWPERRTIAEGARETLDAGLTLASVTLHVERMVSILRDVPVRHIRNLDREPR